MHVVRTCDREVHGCRPRGNAKKHFFTAVAVEETQKKTFFTAVALKESSIAECRTILYMESEHVIEKFTAVALKETQKTIFYGCRPQGKFKRKMQDYLLHVVRTCDREVYGCRPRGNAKTIFYGCRPQGKFKRKMYDYFIHGVRTCDREVHGCRP